MKCPQCGADTPDDQWNCVACRMNVYWASQHFDDLAGKRRDLGLRDSAETPPFLVRVHAAVFEERTERGLNGDNKVRQIARRTMTEGPRGRAHPAQKESGTPEDSSAASRAAAEAGWKQPDVASPHLADHAAGLPGEG